MKKLAIGLSCLLITSVANAGLLQSYFLADGDSNVLVEIQGTSVVNEYSTFSLGYPIAVRDSIWLGHRDDVGATEYDLSGNATGSTSVGGNAFSQLLDGASGVGVNYGVECCGGINSVTIANSDWSNQQILFNLSQGGSGISYDPISDSLFISTFGSTVFNYDLSGNLINSFNLTGSLAALAYEGASDSFWAFDRISAGMVQFDRAGNTLDSFVVSGLVNRNYWGGEIAFGSVDVPEPSTLAILSLGILGLAGRRKKQ